MMLLKNHQATIDNFWPKLLSSKRVLIGTHEHPDGDALGSSLALSHLLESKGCEVTIYIADAPATYFSFLPGFEKITTTKPDAITYDALVLLDYTQLYRTHLEEEFLAHPFSVCIDHHYDNPAQGKYNIVEAKAAATAHILAELYLSQKINITPAMATCLLTGIFTDTGSFMHDSTTPDILKIASELMSRGARLSHIAHETYQKKDVPSLRIWGRALSRIIINEHIGVALSIVTVQDLEECQATLDDLSGVVNMLNTVPQTKFAMLLCEYEPGKIKGSLRSEPHKKVDVSLIAKQLGGGGHRLASGFEINGSLVEQEGQWRICAS